MQKSIGSFALIACWLISIVHAARPEEHREAFIQMHSSGHMIKKKAGAKDGETCGDLVCENGLKDGVTAQTPVTDPDNEMGTKQQCCNMEAPPAQVEDAQQQNTGETAEQAKLRSEFGTDAEYKEHLNQIYSDDENGKYEHMANDPANDIAKPAGALAKMKEEFENMEVKFKQANKAVLVKENEPEDATPENNKIALKGKQWWEEVQKFKTTAAKLRQHAEAIYENIVESHQVAAKKQMRTFKEEMAKLRAVHLAHEAIEQHVQSNDAAFEAAGPSREAGMKGYAVTEHPELHEGEMAGMHVEVKDPATGRQEAHASENKNAHSNGNEATLPSETPP